MIGAYGALGLFFAFVVACAFMNRGKIKKWANTVPGSVPSPDASRREFIEEAHGCYVEPDHVAEKRRAYVMRHKQPVTPWERAAAAEYWEHFKAQQDAKNKAGAQ